MKLLLMAICALLYSSLVEYYVHRFLLHRSYEQEHIKIHHKVFHGINSYEFREVNTYDILSSTIEILRNMVLYLPPALIVFMQNKTFGSIFLVVCLIYNFWEEFLHLNFHRSTDLFYVKLGLFKRLKEHHRVHHYIYNSNYGIGSTFWDLIFRTKKQ